MKVKQVIIWFLIVLVLAIYIKLSGLAPSSGGQILGSHTSNQRSFKSTP